MDPIHWTQEQIDADKARRMSMGILGAVQDGADRTEGAIASLQGSIEEATQVQSEDTASLAQVVSETPKPIVAKLEEIKSAALVNNRILKDISLKDHADIIEKLDSIASILSVPEKETDITPIVSAQNDGVSAITMALETLTKAVNEKEYPEFPEIPEQKELVKIDGEVKVAKPSWYSALDLSPIKRILETIADKESTDLSYFSKPLASIKELLTKIYEKKDPEFKFNKDGLLKVEVDRSGGGGGRLTPTESSALINAATEETLQSTLFNYKLARLPVTGDTLIYLGYLDKDGNWYITEIDEDNGTQKYVKGTSGFTTAWSNRASNTYLDFDSIF